MMLFIAHHSLLGWRLEHGAAGECGNECTSQPECATERAGYVVLGTGIPRVERAGIADSSITWVEAQHDLTGDTARNTLTGTSS